MPNWRDVPDWKFGDMLVLDDSRDPEGASAMFLRWEFTADFNPTESIFRGLLLRPSKLWPDKQAGDIIEPYCGWWMPE